MARTIVCQQCRRELPPEEIETFRTLWTGDCKQCDANGRRLLMLTPQIVVHKAWKSAKRRKLIPGMSYPMFMQLSFGDPEFWEAYRRYGRSGFDESCRPLVHWSGTYMYWGSKQLRRDEPAPHTTSHRRVRREDEPTDRTSDTQSEGPQLNEELQNPNRL